MAESEATGIGRREALKVASTTALELARGREALRHESRLADLDDRNVASSIHHHPVRAEAGRDASGVLRNLGFHR